MMNWGKKLLSVGFGMVAAMSVVTVPVAVCHAQKVDFPEYAYDYRVPCELGQQTGFALNSDQFAQLNVYGYSGQGRLSLKNTASFEIQGAKQCFLSTAYTFKALKEELSKVENRLKAVDLERNSQIKPIDDQIAALQTKYDALNEKIDAAYAVLETKNDATESSISTKVDKIQLDLDKTLDDFEKTCNEQRLSKMTLNAAVAVIDNIIAATENKINAALEQITSLESTKYQNQIVEIQIYFSVEKSVLNEQIGIARQIAKSIKQKAAVYLNFNNRKKEIAASLAPYRNAFDLSKTAEFQVQTLDELTAYIQTSAGNFQVGLEDKVCRFQFQVAPAENARDFRLYYVERPNYCNCEYRPNDLSFDCYRLLGTTNVAQDVCQLLGPSYATQGGECVDLLNGISYEGDLALNGQTKWVVQSAADLRVIRYRLSNVAPIQIQNPIDPKPPTTRVKEHQIK